MELYHYGVKRRSGRYPWGSGKRPYQSSKIPNRSIETKVVDSVLSDLKSNTGIAKEKISNINNYTAGVKWFEDRDYQWQEMEVRRYEDGSAGLFPPATIIRDFMAIGQNPYEFDSFEKNYYSTEELMSENVNPGYEFGASGTANNCIRCGAAAELRARGFDVCAGRSTYGGDFDVYSELFDGAKKEHSSYDDIEETLGSSQQRGVMRIPFDGGDMGHAINYITNEDGITHYTDGQNGNRFDSLQAVQESYGFDTGSDIQYFRLDDKEVNYNNMADMSIIRSNPKRTDTKVRNRYDGRVVDTW